MSLFSGKVTFYMEFITYGFAMFAIIIYIKKNPINFENYVYFS